MDNQTLMECCKNNAHSLKSPAVKQLFGWILHYSRWITKPHIQTSE